MWCYILNNNGGYSTIMFNNYLHINFSCTLVGVAPLCSQLTFWIITPSMMKTLTAHLNRIKIISHLPFPYCLEILLKQRWEEMDTVMTWDRGGDPPSLIKKRELDCNGALLPWELAPIAGPIPPHLQPRSLTDKRQGFLCRRGCRLSWMSPGGRERCLATNSHSSALAELLPSDPGSNNATSSRPTTQFSRRAESTGWLQD